VSGLYRRVRVGMGHNSFEKILPLYAQMKWKKPRSLGGL